MLLGFTIAYVIAGTAAAIFMDSGAGANRSESRSRSLRVSGAAAAQGGTLFSASFSRAAAGIHFDRPSPSRWPQPRREVASPARR